VISGEREHDRDGERLHVRRHGGLDHAQIGCDEHVAAVAERHQARPQPQHRQQRKLLGRIMRRRIAAPVVGRRQADHDAGPRRGGHDHLPYGSGVFVRVCSDHGPRGCHAVADGSQRSLREEGERKAGQDDGQQDEHRSHHGRVRQRQAAAQRHQRVSRRVYPTPRTVWISRGADGVSTFARKYEM
jgi:hypothetical protein